MLSTKSSDSSNPDKERLLQLAKRFCKILANENDTIATKIKNIKELFAQGFTMEFIFPNGDTAMHKIITISKPICDLELMTFALDSIVEFSLLMKQNEEGNSLLHLDISNVTLEAFTLLFSKYPSFVLSSRNNEKDTPLHVAAMYGETESIKLMLSDLPPDKARTLLNTTGGKNYTVIETAIDYLNCETVEFLKNLGVLVTKPTIELATKTNHKNTIKALMGHNQPSKKSNNKKPTITVTKKKNQTHSDKIRNSIQSKNDRLADEFLKTITNKTLNNHAKIKEIKFLFQQGLAKDHKFAGGKSLAHKVVQECKPMSLTILSYLLANGANIETIDDDYCNLLHYAARFFYEDVYEVLLKACKTDYDGNIPALFAKNIKGETPLHIAAFQGDNLFITLTKKYLPPEKFNELLSLETNDHKTALHEAIVAGNQFSIKLLFSYGQGLNIKGNEVDTLIKLAHETQNSKIIKLITELVVNQNQRCVPHQEWTVQPTQVLAAIAAIELTNNSTHKSNNSTNKRKKRRSKQRNSQTRKIENFTIHQENDTFALSEPIAHCLLSSNQDNEKELKSETSVLSSLPQNGEPESRDVSNIKKQVSSTTVCKNFSRASSQLNCSRFSFFSRNVSLLNDEDADKYEEALQAVASLSSELALIVMKNIKSIESLESTAIPNEENALQMEKQQPYIFSFSEEISLLTVEQIEHNVSAEAQICQDKISTLVKILDALPIQNNRLSKKERCALKGMFKDVNNGAENKSPIEMLRLQIPARIFSQSIRK